MSRYGGTLLGLCLLCAPALAADWPTDYFTRQVEAIERSSDLKQYRTRAAWEAARPKLRQELLDMLGLWPLPPRTDLQPTITGTLMFPKYTVEKLHFQSAPGLYVTANLYIPTPAPQKAPTVLYLTGHGNVVENGVSYGSKTYYRRHPAWLAEHGYVCLICDTMQLGELPGEHHGTYRLGHWWWQGRGFTPAGIECWNAMRALDYLGTRPEVDANRIGITGRSGGGAYSWWLAAADDRPACIIPVAGIADLRAHLLTGEVPQMANGVITGHCDCMFMVNYHRWDFARVAALCAPRPLLLGNSDVDPIFPVGGYRRLAEQVRPIYALYGQAERFDLLETKGAHVDTPELRTGAFRWLNRWLRQDPRPVADDEPTLPTPKQLKVFATLPTDARNANVAEWWRRPLLPTLPQTPSVVQAWWPAQRAEWLRYLEQRPFAHWPKPSPVAVRTAHDITAHGLRLRAQDFTSEPGVELRLWVLTAATTERPTQVVLSVADDLAWQEWTSTLGPDFAPAFGVEPAPAKRNRLDQQRRLLEVTGGAFAVIVPRGIGPTRTAALGSPAETHLRRRFALVGQTLDGQRVWDVRRAIQALSAQPTLRDVPLWLSGQRESAGLALLAGLFEPSVQRFDLLDLPSDERSGPTLLDLHTQLGWPQLVALAEPRPVRLRTRSLAAWTWPTQLQTALGKPFLQVRSVDD